MHARIFLIAFIVLQHFTGLSQDGDYIRATDGSPIMYRRQLVFDCLGTLNKDRNDPVARAVCECQVNMLDRVFTKAQYKKYTKKGIIDVPALINENPSIKQRMDDCIKSTGKSILLSTLEFSEKNIQHCIESISQATNKNIDSNKIRAFCTCQVETIRTKKLSDEEIKALADPNSLLFFEMMFRCGDPFLSEDNKGNIWTSNSYKDVKGPVSDTLSVLNLNGMSYVKVKIGSQVLVWLLDTGASDMLISSDIETTLKNEKVLSDQNYLGTSEYEMANGSIEICRKYKVNEVRFGKYYLNNIIVSVSDKAKRILVGRSLLNKFSSWKFNNADNTLIVSQ